jgi:hypothetical protein
LKFLELGLNIPRLLSNTIQDGCIRLKRRTSSRTDRSSSAIYLA